MAHARYLFTPFFFYASADPRDLHSFPTRRSSDLELNVVFRTDDNGTLAALVAEDLGAAIEPPRRARPACRCRSEEHTSELQSRFDLVCRLLLEKKKKKQTRTIVRRTAHKSRYVPF